MLTLFGLVPTAFAYWRAKPDAVHNALATLGLDIPLLRHPNGLLLPSLAGFTLICLSWLLLDRSFDRRRLWNAQAARRQFAHIVVVAAPMLVVLIAVAWQLQPGSVLYSLLDDGADSRGLLWPGAELFGLPRRNTRLWLMIMVFYPVVSVWPQEVLYRAFFFHRYGCLLSRGWQRVLASAIAFGYMHVLFLNPVAPLLTLVGGILFAWTYERSRSVLAASIEHAIYGCWVFTVGLGAYFYGGTVYS